LHGTPIPNSETRQPPVVTHFLFSMGTRQQTPGFK
jgi:hypothetical protein